jgi:hypothetical protein
MLFCRCIYQCNLGCCNLNKPEADPIIVLQDCNLRKGSFLAILTRTRRPGEVTAFPSEASAPLISITHYIQFSWGVLSVSTYTKSRHGTTEVNVNHHLAIKNADLMLHNHVN